MENNFVDYVKISCKSGKGGSGSIHLHRDILTAFGGPDGGDGGRGGHIILKGNKQFWTLIHLKYTKHIKAPDGANGGSSNKSGKEGEDQFLEVPLGTIIRDAETGEFIDEITEDQQQKIILKGGRGGLGNAHFKTATKQTPRYAQPGEEGQTQWFILELKVLADVGLVGFPNTGKSTLLSVVSAAKPKIANYAFTTLTPNLGIVKYRDYQSFVMADIPGIIEGASEGKGLGVRFLKHIERNSTLLFIISCQSSSIYNEYKLLLKELKKYNAELILKNKMIAITQCDTIDEQLIQDLEAELNKSLKGKNKVPYLFISAQSGYNVSKLKDMLWNMLN